MQPKVSHEQKHLTTSLTDAAWRTAEQDVRNRRRTWGLTLCCRGEMNGARVNAARPAMN